jgi:hypothetical protein
MSPSKCRHLHHQEKDLLTTRYRHSLEEALVAAKYLTTQNMLVLQSLTLYLFFASENSHSTWLLSGIALSIAQIMGLHTGNTPASTSIVEREMRRRIWWTICQLDVRVSLNLSLDLHIPHSTTTPLPLHVNDADLETYNDSAAVTERDELTDMTLALLKLEATKTTLRFQRSSSSREKRQKIISDQLKRYEHTYMKYFDPPTPTTSNSTAFRPSFSLLDICRLGTRFIMSRLWKLSYDTFPPSPPSSPTLFPVSKPPSDPLIRYNTTILSIAHQLPCKYKQYGYFFRCKYTQWHALAALLIQMCESTTGEEVDRAWEVLDAVYADWEKIGIAGGDRNKHKVVSKLWEPLMGLFDRAREARKHGLQVSKHPEASFEALVGGTLNTPLSSAPHTMLEPFHHHHHQQQQQYQNDPSTLHTALIGDPFLGSAENFSTEMAWEELDSWAKTFQDGYQEQRMQHSNHNGDQDMDMEGRFGW